MSSTNVFFEDEGAFRAGAVLADNMTSLQVETSTGRRQKIKAAHVLLRFGDPEPGALIEEASGLAAELDPDFLWEVCGEGEFAFSDLATDYYGRAPSAGEAAAFAMCLHASPMHFYKKGRGRYRKAPPDALRAALASVQRKQREAEQIAAWAEELKAHRLPASFRPIVSALLYGPDKQSLEYRALERACIAMHTSPVKLLDACGAIRSAHDYHFNRFLFHEFPHGTEFPPTEDPLPVSELPLAEAQAFSIDDFTTTEFDDAFSVVPTSIGRFRVGVHIAAPALGIPRGAGLDAIARERLSTVYMPGRKITMLPEPVIDRYSLAAGRVCPVVSMYLDVLEDGEIERQTTVIDSVRVVANLRHAQIDDAFAEPSRSSDQPHEAELRVLWAVARRLEAARGKPEQERIDFSFYVDWGRAPEGHVDIVPRPRGSPLDKLVAELMIHVNSSWGKMLAEARWPGLFRVQQSGKVRMSTKPEPHQGLGVSHYLWASSPLRRYSDLVNQRQLLALLQDRKPVYAAGDAELFSAMADFEATYSAYAEFQMQMEHFWCLRWLLQEGVSEVHGSVVRENLVRLERLPMVVRVADLPPVVPETEVVLAVGDIDLLAATLGVRFARLALAG